MSCVDSKVRYHYFLPPEEYYCSSSVFVSRIYKLARNTKLLMACDAAERKSAWNFDDEIWCWENWDEEDTCSSPWGGVTDRYCVTFESENCGPNLKLLRLGGITRLHFESTSQNLITL